MARRRHTTLADRADSRPRRPSVGKSIADDHLVPATVRPLPRRIDDRAARYVASRAVDANRDGSWPADRQRLAEMAADCDRLLKALDLAPPPRRRDPR